VEMVKSEITVTVTGPEVTGHEVTGTKVDLPTFLAASFVGQREGVGGGQREGGGRGQAFSGGSCPPSPAPVKRDLISVKRDVVSVERAPPSPAPASTHKGGAKGGKGTFPSKKKER